MNAFVSILKGVRAFCVQFPWLKRFVKRTKFFVFSTASRLAGGGIDPRPKILGYHSVGHVCNELSLPVQQFEKQIAWLVKNKFHIITLKQYWDTIAAGKKPQPKTVILTFDDGYQDNLKNAAPVLARYGLAATVFIITDYVGKTNGYDEPFLGIPELPLMNWDEIRELKKLGWDIQSHTHSHYPLHGIQPAILEEELLRSKMILEEKLGKPCDFFCYPYGSFDEAAMRGVHRAGYQAAVTCLSGTLSDQIDDSSFRLRRTLVDGLMSTRDFATLFMPAYHRIMDSMLAHDKLSGMLSAYPAGKQPLPELQEAVA